MDDALDFNPRVMRDAAIADAINAAIDAGLQDRPDKPRDYLGASLIGDACDRRIQYTYAGAAKDKPFTGRTLRIFARGHTFEDLAANWMRQAGFRLKTGENGQQLSFTDGQFSGHVDGVILDGPDDVGLTYPAIWECKALGVKGWRGLVKNGVAKQYPRYATQIAVYQGELDLTNPALLTAINADTMELHHVLVPFDQERCQSAIDRAARIIAATAAHELLPRPFADVDHYECRFCDFVDRCWEGPA